MIAVPHDMPVILVVDDHPDTHEAVNILLGDQGYRLVFVDNGIDALMQAAQLIPDLVLLDIMMPGIDGFEVCQRLRANPLLAEVPIIMVTALEDRESRLRGLEAGADDFVSKLFDPEELRARVRTITRLNRYRRLLEERTKFERVVNLSPNGLIIVDGQGTIRMTNPALLKLLRAEDMQAVVGKNIEDILGPEQYVYYLSYVLEVVANAGKTVCLETELLRFDGAHFPAEIDVGHFVWDGQPAAEIIVRDITERNTAREQLERSNAELAEAYDRTIEGWSRALDLRDHETEGHTSRVTEMTLRLAELAGIEPEHMIHVRRGALLHDIGKMGIPDSILHKPGPLNDDEWAVMRQHPVYAYNLLSPIKFLLPALDIPYSHHEKWDGTGYPQGLKGEDIPLLARIFSVVDVWDALRSDRPYRKGLAEEHVLSYLRAMSGSYFDPRIVTLFLEKLVVQA